LLNYGKDNVKELLSTSGAFKMSYAWEGCSGDAWTLMACVDRLVEIGDIMEIRRKSSGQDRLFVKCPNKD